ncbi:hypothetical protein GCM10010517_40670 [Streptosporangium fragile]|uniref:Uncharacterized protein n=1 Tax=Streptosporangium fragile TaxID=46186 RepID=A0ABP6II77_9ACTN
MRVPKLLAVAITAAAVLTTQATPAQAVGNAPATAPHNVLAQQSYDGETVFRGLFLGIGPVAEKFPEFPKPPVDLLKQQEQAAEKYIAAIRADDPAFFDTFGTDMTSGDRVRVLAAMTSANERFAKLLEKDYGPGTQPEGMGLVRVLALAVVAVEVANAYEYVNAYRAYNVVMTENAYQNTHFWQDKVWSLPQMAGDTARLDRERLVSLIAERLAS